MSDLNKAKKILIIDRYKKKRDLAQMNIYSYLDDNFNCKFISKISLIPLINFKKFDIIYLGIFHLDIHARGKRNKFQKDLNSLLRSLNKDQILIVDQADNEIFLEKSTGKNQIKYNRLEGKKYLIDRYSTNVLKEFADENNFSLINMQWSIDPDKFQNTNYETKDIDVTFISTIAKNYEFHKNREKIYQHLTYLQNKYPNYKFHISAPPSYPENQTYGDEYREVLSRSKIFIADGSGRYCLTQKYLEAGISNCFLLGDIPKYPANNIFLSDTLMKEIDLTDRDMLEKALLEALNSLEDAENTSNKLRKKILEDHNIKHIMDKFIAHVLQ